MRATLATNALSLSINGLLGIIQSDFKMDILKGVRTYRVEERRDKADLAQLTSGTRLASPLRLHRQQAVCLWSFARWSISHASGSH